MLHVLTHHGHRGQVLLLRHLEHRAHLDLFLELFVQHLAGFVGVFITNTDGRGVLRGGLAHHEHADAFFGQSGEDTLVHTNHTHHRKTGNSDQTRVVD